MCLADVLLPMDPLADSSAPTTGPLFHRPSASSLADSDEFRMYNAKILPCRKRYHHDWNECIFSHVGEKVQRRCPRKFNYMGIMCPDMKKLNECPKGEECCFAHNSFEYWLHPTRYRTEMCTFGPACKRCVCFFAHNPEQLRGYGKTTLAGSAAGGLPQGAASHAGLYGTQGYNPSLRTPVVVGNRADFEPAGSMAPHSPAFQAPYNNHLHPTQAARPAPITFSHDAYATPMDPYSAVPTNPHRQPSPLSKAYPLNLHYPPVSGAPPAPSLQLPTPTPNAATNLAASKDPIDTSARYISMLASSVAPATSPIPITHPGLLHAYSPGHAAHPAPPSPTGSVASSNSTVDPALPAAPAHNTPFSTADLPAQAPIYLEPLPHLPVHAPQGPQSGRYSPFSADSPLLAFLPPQQPLSAADLLADQLAGTRMTPTLAIGSRTSSRRPSLHTPSIPDSPQAIPASPSQVLDTANQHGSAFADTAPATAHGFPQQHHQHSAVLAGMAARTKAGGSPQPAGYGPHAIQHTYQQYQAYQQYLPQLSAGMSAVSAPLQLHPAQATGQLQYTGLARTVPHQALLPAATAMHQEAVHGGYQQPGRAIRLVFGNQAPTLSPHLQ